MLKIDREIDRICAFIRRQVRDAHAKGVVLGLSGGIDSAVTAALCKKALGADRVTGVLMFDQNQHNVQDHADAISVAKKLGIRTLELKITPIISAISRILISRDLKISRIILANIKARSRMILLYAVANERKLLVAGTGDRSELLLGYFTKYGDGGVDFLPIGHLFKTEVRTLGTRLRLPFEIVAKPSSPNLWPGQKATDELPADYDVLDRILTVIYDKGESKNLIRKRAGASETLVNEIVRLYKISTHKRNVPPKPASE